MWGSTELSLERIYSGSGLIHLTAAALQGQARSNMPSRPPEGRRFKKGQSGNPQGGRLHDPAIKKLKAITRQEIADIGSLVIVGNAAALKRIDKDPKETVLRKWFAKVALNALDSGDSKHFNVLLDRIVGKATEFKEVTGADGSPLIPPTPEQRDATLTQLLSVLGKLDAK